MCDGSGSFKAVLEGEGVKRGAALGALASIAASSVITYPDIARTSDKRNWTDWKMASPDVRIPVVTLSGLEWRNYRCEVRFRLKDGHSEGRLIETGRRPFNA